MKSFTGIAVVLSCFCVSVALGQDKTKEKMMKGDAKPKK